MLTYYLLRRMLHCILKAHSGSANYLRDFDLSLVLSFGAGHSLRNLRCTCGVRRSSHGGGWSYPPVPCSSAVELPLLKARSNLLTLLLQV